MNIEVKVYGPIEDKIDVFLKQSDSLINGFVKIHDICLADPKTYYTREYRDMGFSAEETLLDRLDAITSEMNISELSGIISHGYFGTGLSSAKYLNAHANLMSVFTTIKGNINCMQPFTSYEIKSMTQTIAYALGDLLFSFSKILYFPIDAKHYLELNEPCTFAQPLQAFFSSMQSDPKSYAAKLNDLRLRFISVIPLFEDKPELWKSITTQLPSAVVDMLVDYGEYITDFDLRAYNLEILTIDEEFIDELSNRAENSEYIGNVAPHKWQQFSRMLSDEQVIQLLPYDNMITEDDIDIALKDGEVNNEYFTVLLKKLRGDIGDTTNYFN